MKTSRPWRARQISPVSTREKMDGGCVHCRLETPGAARELSAGNRISVFIERVRNFWGCLEERYRSQIYLLLFSGKWRWMATVQVYRGGDVVVRYLIPDTRYLERVTEGVWFAGEG